MYGRQSADGQLVIGGERSIDTASNGLSYSRSRVVPIVRFFTHSVLRVTP